jgi:prepilin-type processing-associated H-X9-DG protein
LWQAADSAYQKSASPFHSPPHTLMSMPLPVLACPTDPRVTQTQVTRRDRRVALTSYLGVLGTDFLQHDGVLFANSAVRLSDIRDGASQTLLIGERPPSPDFFYGWWYAGFGQGGTGAADMLLGVRERNLFPDPELPPCQNGPYRYQFGRLESPCDRFHFWSLHPGGANFALADASVRFLVYDIDVPVIAALASRRGGE